MSSQFGANTPTMQAGLMRYCLKGLDHRDFHYSAYETDNIGDAIGIDHRGAQGIIEIKRAGVSQTSARQPGSGSWTELRSIEDLRSALRPPPHQPAKRQYLSAKTDAATCVASDRDRVVLHGSHRGIVGEKVGVVALPVAASVVAPRSPTA
jgi:hypothetical protein